MASLVSLIEPTPSWRPRPVAPGAHRDEGDHDEQGVGHHDDDDEGLEFWLVTDPSRVRKSGA
jgi:hypothetical protein